MESDLCAVYSIDGKNILSASTSGTIQTWNTESGVIDRPVEHIAVRINQKVDCAAFSHNCAYIALAHCNWLKDEQTSYVTSKQARLSQDRLWHMND